MEMGQRKGERAELESPHTQACSHNAGVSIQPTAITQRKITVIK